MKKNAWLILGLFLTASVIAGTFSVTSDPQDIYAAEEGDDNTDDGNTDPDPDPDLGKIHEFVGEYSENGKVNVYWETEGYASVNVYLNGFLIYPKDAKKTPVKTATGAGIVAGSCSVKYSMQAGNVYSVILECVNEKGNVVNDREIFVSTGEFRTPELSSVVLATHELSDGENEETGFMDSMVDLHWTSQANANYEIYRASKDSRDGYVWIATVRSETAEEDYVYHDKTAKLGKNYYKICQSIKEDKYVYQPMTALFSEAKGVTVTIPKPTLKLQQNEKGQIVLAMKAKKLFKSGYEIYRRSAGSSYKKIGSAITGTFVDDTAVFGERYAYRVRTYFYNNETKKTFYSAYSAEKSISSGIGSFNLYAKASAANAVRLDWTSAKNAGSYEIYWAKNVKKPSYKRAAVTTRTSYNLKLSANQNYLIKVVACGTASNHKKLYAKAVVSYTTGFCAPQNIKVNSTTYKYDKAKERLEQRDTITWDRVYGVSGYLVEEYSEDIKGYEVVAKLKGSSKNKYTTSHVVTTKNKEAKFRISAYKGAKVNTGKPFKVSLRLAAVNGVRARTVDDETRITWMGVTGATNYRIYRANENKTQLLGVSFGRSFTDDTTVLGMNYTYYVCAINRNLKLQSANSSGAEYARLPEDLKRLSAWKKGSKTIVLQWRKTSDAESYNIYVKKGKEPGYQLLKTVSAKTDTYSHNNVVRGETYTYKVVACRKTVLGTDAESKGKTVTKKA